MQNLIFTSFWIQNNLSSKWPRAMKNNLIDLICPAGKDFKIFWRSKMSFLIKKKIFYSFSS